MEFTLHLAIDLSITPKEKNAFQTKKKKMKMKEAKCLDTLVKRCQALETSNSTLSIRGKHFKIHTVFG